MAEVLDTLMIAANFFGYAEEIRGQLQARGMKVARFEDRPAIDSLSKALTRVAPAAVRARADAYFAGICSQLRAQPIEHVLVIKGEALSTRAIERLRRTFPRAKFTLYFWDSYRNMPPHSSAKVALFDRAFTFDPEDAQRDRRLTYRPLFYCDAYAACGDEHTDLDVLFLGTAHSDRYAVLKRIAKILPPNLVFKRILYLQAPWLYAVRRVVDPTLWGATLDEFTFAPVAKHEIVKLVARARVVVDIERAVQRGLTMRTIEALGAHRKLITTNPYVAKADFFDPANVAVIDRRAPQLAPEFFEQPYRPPASEILRRYSLDGWLDEVMCA